MQTYSVSEIAAALGTDQVTVRRWIAKGDLPGTLDTRKGGYQQGAKDRRRSSRRNGCTLSECRD